MSMFFSLLVFYAKQMLKSFLYLGTFLFMVIMLFFRFVIRQNDFFGYTNYGNFVGEMTLIVQAVMLLFMIFFYKLFSDEYKFGANNLFVGSFRITLFKITALFCNHLLFLVVLIGFQIALIFFFYRTWEIPFSYFYTQTVSYVIVYWFLPFVLAFFLGIFTALLFGKNKISFVFMMVVWLAIGPMNTELFSRYFRQFSFSDAESLFYIGPLNSSDVFKEVVGYNLSLSVYMKIFFWIVLAIMAVFAAVLKTTRTVPEKLIIIMMIVFLLIGNSVIFPKIFEGGKLAFSYADYDQESLYYKTRKATIHPDTLQYSIQGYDIQLDARNGTKAKTKVILDEIQNPTLSFVLYHFFDVKKVTDKEGQNLPFTQKGDFVVVERTANDPTDELTFYYQMKNSSHLPVSSNYLYLPNYFSWIPMKAKHPPFDFDYFTNEGTIDLSMQTKEPVHYTLSFKGDVPFYTNLPRNKEGEYSGEVSGGITVVAGMFLKKQIDEWEIVYPNDWQDITENWPIFQSYLIQAHKKLVDMFQIQDMELPKKIIFLNPTWETNAYLSSDHLLFQTHTLYSIASPYTLVNMPEVLLKALLWNYDKREFSSYEQIVAFNQLLTYLIRNELELEMLNSYYFHTYLPEHFEEYDQETQRAVRHIYEELFQLSDEEKKQFLLLWYKEMDKVSDSWVKTEKLFQEFKEGRR